MESTAIKHGHVHGEAFMLMQYVSDDRGDHELLWNSRDGVTPFVITLRNGKQATHTNWHGDVYAPDHKPSVGDRIFIDMTEEHARESAERNAATFWDNPKYPASQDDRWDTVEELAEDLERSYLEEARRGAPQILEVTEDIARERGWL